MASTRASISKASKRPKINIIPPKQLFVDLTQDDTKTPSPKLQLSSPSAPNAPSKTPSTKDTSSSSIDYIPKSPTSSTSLSPNVEEPIFVQDSNYAKHDDAEFDNTYMPMDQGEDFAKTDEQPNDEDVPKYDWYKKSKSDTSPDPE
ncbi:hypothetical protein Tco_0332885 [Tanacetum coccineum]